MSSYHLFDDGRSFEQSLNFINHMFSRHIFHVFKPFDFDWLIAGTFFMYFYILFRKNFVQVYHCH